MKIIFSLLAASFLISPSALMAQDMSAPIAVPAQTAPSTTPPTAAPVASPATVTPGVATSGITPAPTADASKPAQPAPSISAQLIDGSKIEIAPDSSVSLVNADGTKTPAPDGILTLRDGVTFDVKGGKRVNE